jgi:hypothetical protein
LTFGICVLEFGIWDLEFDNLGFYLLGFKYLEFSPLEFGI